MTRRARYAVFTLLDVSGYIQDFLSSGFTAEEAERLWQVPQGQQFFATAPWIGLFPGLALTLVVFGINVFGDSLRDILDPRLRGT